jgi:hypothetical protein
VGADLVDVVCHVREVIRIFTSKARVLFKAENALPTTINPWGFSVPV